MTSEDTVKYNALICLADDLYNIGKEENKMWHLCLAYIKELERLIPNSYSWLKEKYEASKDHPCPKQDFPNYIVFFKVGCFYVNT